MVMGIAAQQIEKAEKVYFLRAAPTTGLLSLARCF